MPNPRPFDTPFVREQDALELRRVLRTRTVILASSSPRRREILRSCRVSFRVVPPMVQEPAPSGRDSRAWTRRWAERKALSLRPSSRVGLVVAADTIVVFKGRAMGKPADAANARAMLNHLSGRTHRVITGVAVVDTERSRAATASEVSYVTFRPISQSEITAYIRTGEAWDKAGAYALQGHGGQFVVAVQGPVDNVVGLPVRRLAQLIDRVTNR